MSRLLKNWPVIVLLFISFLFQTGCGGGGGSSSIAVSSGGGGGTGTGGGTASLVISSTSMPAGVAGNPYSFTFDASGGTPPYTWSVTPGYANVSGSTLSATGVFSGTLQQGNWGIAATVHDSGSPQKTASTVLGLSIYPQLAISTSNLPASHTNIPYDEIVQASNVKSWSISAGQLPPGFQLVRPISTQVEISGTPAQTGTFTFTVQADSLSGPAQSATKTFTITVDDNPAVVTSQVLDVIHNLPYRDTLQAVNGTPPYHWTLQSGSLPTGIALDGNTGVISGTYSNYVLQSIYNPVFQVTDSGSPARSGSRMVTVYLLETLNVASCGDASTPIGQPYVGSISIYGGRQPYTWSMTGGTLPPGLNLSNGLVTGIPTQMGDYSYTMHVQDSSNPAQSADRVCNFTVTPPDLILSNSLPAQIPLGVAFEGFQGAQGGTPPYLYALSSGTLPAGLTFDNSTGEVKGAPTALGSSQFTIQVSDSASNPQVRRINYTIVVVTPLGRNDSIPKATPMGNGSTKASISPYANPADVANPDTDYYRIIAAAGATVEIKAVRYYNVIDPVLELLDSNGVRLSSCNQPLDLNGDYSGTFASDCLNDDINPGIVQDSALQIKVPGTTGTQTTFYAHVLDWRGDARPDMVYYFVVNGAVDPLAIVTKVPTALTKGTVLNLQMQSSGGTGPMTWSVSSGSLPSGLTLSSAGLLSGTPSAEGDYQVNLTVTDAGNPAQSVTTQATIRVANPVQIVSQATFPDACVNQPYSFTVQVANGIPPYSWGFAGLWVPINLDTSTGVFSGISTVTGTFTGYLAVSDASSYIARQTVTLTVKPCP